MNKFLGQMKNGIIDQNPTMVLILGMCPTLAVTTSLQNGIGMGLAATAVLICSNVVISLLRKVIPDKIRIAAFIVIIASFVTMVDLLLQAYLPDLSQSLGIFIPLIVVNCIIMARAEAYAFKNGPLSSAVDGLSMGLGFTLSLCIVSSVREILGNGTILGHAVLTGFFQPALMFILPAGGFLTLGVIIAAYQKLMSLRKGGKKALSLSSLFSLSLGAILIENFVLVKFLGICPFLGVSKKTDTAAGMGIAVVFVMGVASMATWAVNHFFLIPLGLEYMQTVAFILVIAALVQFVEMFLQKSVPSLYEALGIYLPLITTNCAVLGVTLLNVQKGLDFIGSLVYGVSAAVGFLLAIVLFASIRERLEFSDYPKAFEGFPIALVSAALLAMAFMGFQGLSIS